MTKVNLVSVALCRGRQNLNELWQISMIATVAPSPEVSNSPAVLDSANAAHLVSNSALTWEKAQMFQFR